MSIYVTVKYEMAAEVYSYLNIELFPHLKSHT